MPSLIPHLRDLCFGGNRYGVPVSFAETFFRQHRDPANDDTDAWRTAQQHWEYVMEKCLDSDAVSPDAVGETAIHQAVIAAVEVLQVLARRGRCPRCPAPSRTVQDAMANQAGA